MSGEDVSNTFTGLASNLDEAFDVVAGKATENLTKKLKELLDLDIVTKEEFEAKKKKLLDL